MISAEDAYKIMNGTSSKPIFIKDMNGHLVTIGDTVVTCRYNSLRTRKVVKITPKGVKCEDDVFYHQSNFLLYQEPEPRSVADILKDL